MIYIYIYSYLYIQRIYIYIERLYVYNIYIYLVNRISIFYNLIFNTHLKFHNTISNPSQKHLPPSQATLPETNMTSHLKMDVWNTSFLWGWPIFRFHVSFREDKSTLLKILLKSSKIITFTPETFPCKIRKKIYPSTKIATPPPPRAHPFGNPPFANYERNSFIACW